jgi:hypothetical protein
VTHLSELTGQEFTPSPKKLTCHADLKGWLLDWIGKLSTDQTAWSFQLLYNLWLARNDARESNRLEDPRSVAKRSQSAVKEWNNVHSKDPTVRFRELVHWQAPALGWCKVNTDGAFRHGEFEGGGGVIIRDHHGGFLAGASHFFPTLLTPKGRSC